jgi:inward rectifier potassium channel
MAINMKNSLHLKKVRNTKDEIKDTGFGTQSARQRSINPNGTFNIEKTGLPFMDTSNFYTNLITMKAWKFIGIILTSYLIANTIFAAIYYAIGVEHFNGVSGVTPRDKFFDAFFFSAQTISTVGYGHISPNGFATSIVAAIESMVGILGFAVVTGVLYGRFSKPKAKIMFSQKAIVAPYRNMKGLMFRIANKRKNQLIEVEVDVVIALNMLEEDRVIRRFFTLELERRKVSFFPLSWTIVHPINEQSPISGFTAEDLENSEAELFILIKGFDDTYSQTVHSRYSYIAEDIEWNKKFINIIKQNEEGKTVLELDKIDSFEKADSQ